ncbi:transaldolase [Flavobacterium sp.]
MEKNNVKQIHNFGQSIWLDFIDRQIMNSGKLKKMIDEDGIRGVTSNPSIFEKAITGSNDYQDDILKHAAEGKNNEAIFYIMAIKDIQRAADLFKPTFDESNGVDGFVSLEVSPLLARDTDGTIKQAMELWQLVDRKNIMIKIPGTVEGLPAIRKCISEGVNINVTLLFGLPRYKEVVEAYLMGLEDRVKMNKPIDNIQSVASFFLSRIDVMIDPLLKVQSLTELKGEGAIASAREAYQIYKKIFNSERFEDIAKKEAHRQRLLWASTSSKDPSFSDVKYIETLIGNETVNTVPLETIDAFRDHGLAASTLEQHLDRAADVLVQLKKHGIELNEITQKLENEGIEKFNKAYDQVLTAIDNQRKIKHSQQNE